MAFDFPNSPTLGQVYQGYTWDGEKWVSTFNAPNTSGVIGIQVFPASGTYTPSPSMTTCVIEVVGGGGGGGGVPSTTSGQATAGGGGASGAYASLTATVAQIGPSQTVTIGAGGAGGAAGLNTGSAGSATSVGSLCIAAGGAGGNSMTAQASSVCAGGTGGSAAASTGTIVAGGSPGQIAVVLGGTPTAGNGGSSYFGGAARGAGITTTGAAGTTGSGGSGGVSSVATAQAGGKGGDGLVVITEYGMTAITSSTANKVLPYTVAALPAGTVGAMAFATNCRVFNGAGVQEGAGAGTGGLVTYNGTAWKIAGTNITAVA